MDKKFYESKTFWFAVIFGLVQVAGLFGFADYTPGRDVAEIVNILVAVAVIILRLMTSKKIEF